MIPAAYAAGLGGALILYVVSRTPLGATVVANVTDAALDALPRGIRNNNPGNIDWIENAAKRWQGMVRKELPSESKNPRFGVFNTAANGVRAIAKEFLLDESRGIRTIEGFVGSWAPPTENNTTAYAQAVARELRMTPKETFSIRPRLPEFVAAIIRHENGVQPYPLEDLRKWVYLT